MIHTGDKLLCTHGNGVYQEGHIYTVGRMVSDRHFQLLTGYNDDHWYATFDDNGIHVRFDAMKTQYSDAWFDKVYDEDMA